MASSRLAVFSLVATLCGGAAAAPAAHDDSGVGTTGFLRWSGAARLLSEVSTGTSNKSAATPTEPPGAFDDVPENCELEQNCTGNGAMPRRRGICVEQGGQTGGHVCRDVCNPDFTPQQYIVGSNIADNMAFAGIVSAVRAGTNPFVQCPAGLAQGDICPPGKECPHHMRRKFSVPNGRGMCVIDSSQPNSRACWDMCDEKKLPSAYSMGTSVGVEKQVESVRAGGWCPSRPWWPWVLAVLGILMLLACCAALFIAQRNRNRKRGPGVSSSRNYDDRPMEMDYGQDYGGMGEPMVDDGPQGPGTMMPGSQRDEDRQREDDMRAQQEYQMQQQQYQLQQPEDMLHDALPPEPPREAQFQVQSQREDPSHAFLQPEQMQYGAMPQAMPSGSSMKIPGLEEPNLFSSIQPLVVPGTGVPAASSSILMPSLSQTQGVPQYRTGSMAAASYSTQVPTFMPGGVGLQSPMSSPPASVQVRPGALPSQQASPFFTQIVRR
mmetsp:Transcript_43825/g.113131  ORF Transcript_43825/g.113131 Transcript_43825/m.113131 type:complete len:493 (-) Transcript_43825:128-1606(-)